MIELGKQKITGSEGHGRVAARREGRWPPAVSSGEREIRRIQVQQPG
jgi:hypothetical protein